MNKNRINQFWVGPHIAVGTAGQIGEIFRSGREKISSACGALIAFNGQIASDKLNMDFNPLDTEMSLLRQSVLSKLSYGQKPTLLESHTQAEVTNLQLTYVDAGRRSLGTALKREEEGVMQRTRKGKWEAPCSVRSHVRA